MCNCLQEDFLAKRSAPSAKVTRIGQQVAPPSNALPTVPDPVPAPLPADALKEHLRQADVSSSHASVAAAPGGITGKSRYSEVHWGRAGIRRSLLHVLRLTGMLRAHKHLRLNYARMPVCMQGSSRASSAAWSSMRAGGRSRMAPPARPLRPPLLPPAASLGSQVLRCLWRQASPPPCTARCPRCASAARFTPALPLPSCRSASLGACPHAWRRLDQSHLCVCKATERKAMQSRHSFPEPWAAHPCGEGCLQILPLR